MSRKQTHDNRKPTHDVIVCIEKDKDLLILTTQENGYIKGKPGYGAPTPDGVKRLDAFQLGDKVRTGWIVEKEPEETDEETDEEQ